MCCPVWYNTVRNTNLSAFDRVSKENRGKGAIQIEIYYYYYYYFTSPVAYIFSLFYFLKKALYQYIE